MSAAEIKVDLRDLYINAAKQIEVSGGRKARAAAPRAAAGGPRHFPEGTSRRLEVRAGMRTDVEWLARVSAG